MREETLYKLSYTQKNTYIGALFSLEPQNTDLFNTLPCVFECADVDLDALEKSLNRLVARNDALRIRLVCRPPLRLRFYIAEPEEEKFPRVSFAAQKEYEAWLEQQCRERVRTFKSRLYSFTLFSLPQGRGGALLCFNHLAVDGYSFSLIHNQLDAYYCAYRDGVEPPALPVGSYLDYLRKADAYLQSQQYKRDVAYWREQFSFKKQPRFSLPGGRRSLFLKGDSQRINIDGELYAGLQLLCKERGFSLVNALLCTCALTVYVLTGKDNFCLGMLNHGRQDAVSRRTIGCMQTSPVMMFLIDADKSFAAFCADSFRDYLDSLRYTRLPGSALTPLSYGQCVKNGLNFNFNWLMFSAMDLGASFAEGELKGRLLWTKTNITQLYCAVFDDPKNGCVGVELRYQTHAFSGERIAAMLQAAQSVLEAVVAAPDAALGACLPLKVTKRR